MSASDATDTIDAADNAPVTAITRGTLGYHVPAGNDAKARARIAAVVAKLGGTVDEHRQITFSPELAEYGFPLPLNIMLTSLGYGSVAKLEKIPEPKEVPAGKAAKVETVLLAKPGFHYSSLRTTIRLLAARSKRLGGCTVDPEDLIEHLGTDRSAFYVELYARLKQLGYHAQSQLKAADRVELEQLLTDRFMKQLDRVMEAAEIRFAPLLPHRTLRNLKLHSGYDQVLMDAGIPLSTCIKDVPARFARRLPRLSASVAQAVRNGAHQLRSYGINVP